MQVKLKNIKIKEEPSLMSWRNKLQTRNTFKLQFAFFFTVNETINF